MISYCDIFFWNDGQKNNKDIIVKLKTTLDVQNHIIDRF